MPVELVYSQTVCTDEFVDELESEIPPNLENSADFPPLTTAATADGWDCINSQETEDIVVTEDVEDWEQLGLAVKKPVPSMFSFSTVARQTEHVPSPVPTLIAPTAPLDVPLKRRKKPARETDVYEYENDGLWDLYPSNKVDKKLHKSHTRRRNQLLHCFDTIPTATPQEPVVTHPHLHRCCAYSMPLTDRQYKHAVFKHVQWDRRWMSYGKYYGEPEMPNYNRNYNRMTGRKDEEDSANVNS
jgi:hypothetical protein